MMSLNDIPNEVVIQILEHVSPCDIFNFVLVQRRVYQLARDRLDCDRDIYRDYNRSAVLACFGEDPRLLMLDVDAYHFIAYYIRSLTLDPGGVGRYRKVPFLMNWTEDALQRLIADRSNMTQVKGFAPKAWLERMEGHSTSGRGATGVLAMCVTPRLRSLELLGHIEDYEPYLSNLFLHCSTQTSDTNLIQVEKPLARLQSFSIESGPGLGEFLELQSLVDLIYLPSLREFSASGVMAYIEPEESIQPCEALCSRQGSPLRSLKLCRSAISPLALFQFIKPMTELQEMTYEHSKEHGGPMLLDIVGYRDEFVVLANDWLQERNLIATCKLATGGCSPTVKIRKISGDEILQRPQAYDVPKPADALFRLSTFEGRPFSAPRTYRTRLGDEDDEDEQETCPRINFDWIPDKVVSCIIDHVRPGDILNFVLTERRIRTLAVDRLARDRQLSVRWNNLSVSAAKDGKSPWWLLNQLVTSPLVNEYIHTLNFDNSVELTTDNEHELEVVRNAIVAQGDQADEHSTHRMYRHWHQALVDGSGEAAFYLCLTRLLHLQHLTTTWFGPLFEKVALDSSIGSWYKYKKSHRIVEAFDKLKSLHIQLPEPSCAANTLSLGHLSRIMRGISLRELHVRYMRAWGKADDELTEHEDDEDSPSEAEVTTQKLTEDEGVSIDIEQEAEDQELVGNDVEEEEDEHDVSSDVGSDDEEDDENDPGSDDEDSEDEENDENDAGSDDEDSEDEDDEDDDRNDDEDSEDGEFQPDIVLRMPCRLRNVKLEKCTVTPDRLFRFCEPASDLEHLAYEHRCLTELAGSDMDMVNYREEFIKAAGDWLFRRSLVVSFEEDNEGRFTMVVRRPRSKDEWTRLADGDVRCLR